MDRLRRRLRGTSRAPATPVLPRVPFGQRLWRTPSTLTESLWNASGRGRGRGRVCLATHRP